MIVREGLIFILGGLVLTLIFIGSANRFNSYGLFALSLVFALLTLFVTFFFRDPDRTCPEEPLLLVAPADGKIVDIKKIPHHPFIGGEAVKISIFLSIVDVHVNRIPISGVVNYVKYIPGKFFAAFEDKASDLNEQTEIGLTSSDGHKIAVKQIAGIIARRIVCRLKDNDSVTIGQRFGMIRFGSRTDIILPVDSRLNISLGDKVLGGQTIIGHLPDRTLTEDRDKAVREDNAKI